MHFPISDIALQKTNKYGNSLVTLMIRILRARIISCLNLRCANYKLREIIRGRKLLYYFFLKVRKLFKCTNYLKHDARIICCVLPYRSGKRKTCVKYVPRATLSSLRFWFQLFSKKRKGSVFVYWGGGYFSNIIRVINNV